MEDSKIIQMNFKKCPICARKTTKKFYPFCSKRCGNLDLGHWLGGIYRIPTEELQTTRDDVFEDVD